MSPFGWVEEWAQPRVLAVLTVMVVGLSAVLVDAGRGLASEAAPQGIASYELAGSVERSRAILDSWSPAAKATAMWIQGLDSLYLIVYPAWLSLAALRLGRRLGSGWRRAAVVVSWLVLVAAPLDAVENHALDQQLVHGAEASYAALAWWCAVPKFALVGVGAGFLVVAGGAALVARLRGA